MKFVLVAGAAGYLGRHVVSELKRQGHRVRALVRQRDPLWKRSEDLAPAVGAEVDEIVVGDLTQPQSLQGVCHQIQYIVSCAALSPQDRGKLTHDQVDYHGNRNLLIEAINARSVEKFIFVSKLAGGQDDPQIAAKEKFVKDLQESVMTSYIIRPTLAFSELLPLLYMARRGRIWLPGDSARKVNPLHGRDLAEVCLRGMIAKEKEVEVGGHEIYSLDELARLMFKVQDKSPRIVHVPGALSGLTRQLLQIFARKQVLGFDTLLSDALKTGPAPVQGHQQLEAYLKEYIQSPFYRI